MKTMRGSSIILVVSCWSLFAVSTQAQEFDAQKLLLDSINYEKLDVAGVKTALDKGANPNWVSDTKRRYSVIGHLAQVGPWSKDAKAEEKGVGILQMLFEAGAKLQPCDREILYSPIAEGWALFTEVLLRNGANPTREVEGWTPMEIAAKYSQAKIVELLRKHGVPALENGIAAQLRFINAASFGDIPGMEEAIRNGANVNGENRRGETALVATIPIPVITSKTYSTIQYLLKKGADPTIQGREIFSRTTALHIAIKQSRLILDAEIKKLTLDKRFKDSPLYAKLIIQSLLKNGALVSARDSDGMTPLHIAAKYNNIVGGKMLIEAGSKVMPRDDKGKTPLDYAESGEMIKLLKTHGAKEE